MAWQARRSYGRIAARSILPVTACKESKKNTNARVFRMFVFQENGTTKGNRTLVFGVRGQRPDR